MKPLANSENHAIIRQCIIQDLNAKFGEDVLLWRKMRLEKFHAQVLESNRKRLTEDDALRKKLGRFDLSVDEGNKQWGFAPSTFQNCIKSNRRGLGERKIRSLAVFLGYAGEEDYLVKRVGLSYVLESSLANEKAISVRVPKPLVKKRKAWAWVGVYGLVILAALAGVLITQSKTPISPFTTSKEVKVLVFPLNQMAGVQGQNYRFEQAILTEFERLASKDVYCDSLIEVRTYMELSAQTQMEERVEMGRQLGADVIIWGEYSDFLTLDKVMLNFRYRYLDDAHNVIAQTQGEYANVALKKAPGANMYAEVRGSIKTFTCCLMASIASKTEEFDRIIHYLEHVDLDQMNPFSYLIRGHAYYRSSEFRNVEQAFQDTDLGISHFPENVISWNNLSVFARQTGRLKKAEVAARTALALDSTYFKAMVSLGNCFADPTIARYSDAVEWYERALSYDPNDAITIWNLGEIYSIMKYPEASGKYFLMYHDLVPEDSDVYEWLRRAREDLVLLSDETPVDHGKLIAELNSRLSER